MKKMHIGREKAGEDVYELFTDETRKMTDAAFWHQVRDVVEASCSQDWFDAEVERLTVAAEERITNFDIPQVVDVTMSKVGIRGEDRKESIVAYLANGADGAGLTRWGLVNAITATASNEESFDASIDLERAGAKVLELSKRDWKQISEKAA